jgi:lysyl-tRNA synthetase, class II
VQATKLPDLLSPCLHDIPVNANDHENSPYARHVQFLANKNTADVIKLRSAIIQYLRQFFLDRSFLEINTPILAATAGGAIARPFHTSATEFPEKQLSLRIAPELWLKRLVVGGFDKVFEIGPSFRNEGKTPRASTYPIASDSAATGLDRTHNPEFTTCEFYHAYATLDELMSMTESLFSGLSSHVRELKQHSECDLISSDTDFSSPFRRIDFISGIEDAIGQPLPELTSTDASAKLIQLFGDLSLSVPELPNLPRLMDKLSSTYLEPQCQDPTFILNPPECLSPLSKSFTHPTCNQQVAARCELFIGGREFVNAYEEENSPFEQRRKFQDQQMYNAATGEPGEFDESYLQALEWGLPPTGGWGCGVDRLCMLFTGTKRIGDILPFGSLRAVTRAT